MESWEIRQLLDQHRPERYESTDKSWMEPVVEIVAQSLSAQEARFIAADHKVHSEEATATRPVKRILRDFANGVARLEWLDVMHWPVAIDGKTRVQVGKMTADDWRAWANQERRQAMDDMAARHAACEGAERVAEMMLASGAATTGDIADLLADDDPKQAS